MSDFRPTVFVLGTAERKVDPDLVRVKLGVQSRIYPSPAEAMRETAEKRALLLDHIRERHPDADVFDADIRVDEETKRVERKTGPADDRQTSSQWVKLGHRAFADITVETGSDDAPRLLETATRADTAGSPWFKIAKETAYRVHLELDTEAVRDARRRAEAIAAAENLKVGPLLNVGEAQPPERMPEEEDDDVVYSMSLEGPPSGIADRLGDVRSDPFTLSSTLPVRFVLVPAESAS